MKGIPDTPRSISKRLKETHTISVPYTVNGEEATAFVILDIDYQIGKFTITPTTSLLLLTPTRMERDNFLFKQGNLDDVNKWKAVAQAIEDATKLAELYLKNKDVKEGK